MNPLKWNDLAEMHLVLREHGWEPEQVDDEFKIWAWTLPGAPVYFVSSTRVNAGRCIERRMGTCNIKRTYYTAAPLAKKLKALSKSVTKSADA